MTQQKALKLNSNRISETYKQPFQAYTVCTHTLRAATTYSWLVNCTCIVSMPTKRIKKPSKIE